MVIRSSEVRKTDTYGEAVERYGKYLSAVQKKMLKKKAKALSLANAAAREKLAAKDLERTRKANALLTDYGLATSLYRAPSSGVDALSRRMSGTEQGEAALYAQESDALLRAAKRMRRETQKKRNREKKKKNRIPKPETGTTGAEGQPGRTVTVRKL